MEGHTSTFTFTRSLSYITSMLFTFVHARKLRDSGNPPLGALRKGVLSDEQ